MLTGGRRVHRDENRRYASIKPWDASDVDVRVKGGFIHLIGPCGDERYFTAVEMERLIKKLEDALRERRAQEIG